MDKGMLDLKGYGATILDGAWITLEAALLSVLVAVILGMMGALAKAFKIGWQKVLRLFTPRLCGVFPI